MTYKASEDLKIFFKLIILSDQKNASLKTLLRSNIRKNSQRFLSIDVIFNMLYLSVTAIMIIGVLKLLFFLYEHWLGIYKESLAIFK